MQTTRKIGFTLVELLVALAILGLVAAILFPVFAHAREKARQETCASNLRQIGLATMQYAGDNDGLLFPATPHAFDDDLVIHWSHCENQTPGTPDVKVDASCGPLSSFIKSAGVWVCPSASGLKAADYYMALPPAYGLNSAYTRMEHDQGRPVSLAQVQSPAETILAADGAIYNTVYSDSLPSWSENIYIPSSHEASVHGRHSGLANVLWLDGHVKALTPISPDARRQAINIGDILKGAYTGDAQTDDYYYELVKPTGKQSASDDS